MTTQIMDPYATPQSDVQPAEETGNSEVKIFSFSGRLGRVRYMAYSMGLMLVLWFGGGILAAIAVPAMASSPDSAVLGGVMGLLMLTVYGVMLVAMFTLAVRRINDFDTSGWLSLLLLVPLLNFFFVLALWFVPGSQGANRYGKPTPPNGTGVTIMAVLAPLALISYIGVMAAIAIPAYQQYVEKAAQMQDR
jgi:uncharacterized membrane protein YhaH (DUF805 family)